MMPRIFSVGLVSFCALVLTAGPALASPKDDKPKNKPKKDEGKTVKESNGKTPALAFTMKDIDGKEQDLRQYAGKVVLMVNVASKCGFTPQYKGLEALHEKYKDQGLVILGFPANDFGKQEPGSDEQIKSFCTGKYNVTFPMFSKVHVKGSETCPLYKYLSTKSSSNKHGAEVSWNFNKFLVNRHGEVVGHYDSRVTPEDEKLNKAIEKALAANAESSGKSQEKKNSGA